MYIADLHIHSRFSRATSKDGDLPHLDWWARRKGIRMVGTGDFTHPAWRAELREQLVPAGEGVYTLRQDLRLPDVAPGEAPRFVITGEISCIYKRHGRTRKVHNLILLPSLEAADELSARLEAIGNIHSDGRPILGLDSRDLLELVEKCLRHDDIPCLVTGREDFLDDPAVRGALGFLRSLVVPADNAALESALRLLWNCPADLIQKAQTLCQKMGTLDSAALQEAVRGHGILENWLDRTEVWLPLVQTETPRKLVEQWEEQYGTSPALERLRNTAVFHEDFDSLWDALVLGQEADLRRASGKHWASGAVRLMTLHGAKGLEFPAVFLAGLSAGAMPLESPGRPADAEEERRLFFVGLTRAREELILTAAPEFSPFLRELPEPVVRETTGRRRVAEQLRLF